MTIKEYVKTLKRHQKKLSKMENSIEGYAEDKWILITLLGNVDILLKMFQRVPIDKQSIYNTAKITLMDIEDIDNNLRENMIILMLKDLLENIMVYTKKK